MRSGAVRSADSEPAEEDDAAGYAHVVGLRLRSVRRQKRLSLQAVERASDEEFKASVLGAYERGERTISVPRLQRLAQIYAVPVDQLLPADISQPLGKAAATSGAARSTTASERPTRKITVDLVRMNEVTGPEKELLRHFLASVQVQRQDFNGKVITIREGDLRVMASMFGRSVEALASRLEELGLLYHTSSNGVS